MKINQIVLNNFGSYEGETVFDTDEIDGRNIVLFGGKNGAGKTTLFTAMRLCLYGYKSMGYKNPNSYYNRAVIKLINNTAKLVRPVHSDIQMTISIIEGRGIDKYILVREWNLDDSLSESFNVLKNDCLLSDGEVADFEKYLLSIIPPELFNLYFFDGEKIADFFLDEGSNNRIKNAFLTLCGYDTFDIMQKNFKRLGTGKSTKTGALEKYLQSKENVENEKEKVLQLTNDLENCINKISECDAALVVVEKNYRNSGGITQSEWDKKIQTIKEEEKKRETWNALIKKWANEMIPFLMIKNQIEELKEQIKREDTGRKYRNFCEVIDNSEIKEIISSQIELVKKVAFKKYGEKNNHFLDLSMEQSVSVIAQINSILDFEYDKVARCKRAIKRSIDLSNKLRKDLENSNVSSVDEYVKRRSELFEKKSLLLSSQVKLEQELYIQQEKYNKSIVEFSRNQDKLEEELKNASINDISTKGVVMLDKLQKILFRKQISKVEEFFRNEIRSLMRKANFIDDISIDENFNIHLYRFETFSPEKLQDVFKSNNKEQVFDILGETAILKLIERSKSNTYLDLVHYIINNCNCEYVLPIEIDKTSFSNGEKQIFIMAIYHSLIQLCTHEIPFIIDTPFARIDTEHRKNISKYFFSNLKGQVFILSTNEEIDSDHVKIMKDNIAATYMLENTDNKRTIVIKNKYFEE